jgi:hypothetical protein
MAEHALDGEMGLAGIGRPEDRDKPRSGAKHGHGPKGIGWNRLEGKSKPPKIALCGAASTIGRFHPARLTKCFTIPTKPDEPVDEAG